MQIHTLVLVVLLFSLHYTHGIHQPDLPSFGDFMEYFLSVPLSCMNATDARNATNIFTVSFVDLNREISGKYNCLMRIPQKRFADCTIAITASSTDIFGNLNLICENQEKYLQCWDQLKKDIVSNCHQNGHLPALYTATVKNLCGNDGGNTTISKRWWFFLLSEVKPCLFVGRQFKEGSLGNDRRR